LEEPLMLSGVKLKNPAAVRAGIRDLAMAKGVPIRTELKRNAGIINHYAMKMTPPFLQKGGLTKGTIKQSWNVQKRTGEKAVKRDVAKAFQPIRTLQLLKNAKWAAAVNKMIRRRDITGLERFLAGKGVHNKVVPEATLELLNSKRTNRGRVKINLPFLVLSAPSITRLQKRQVADVGKAKAGWANAGSALPGEKPPDWITRHATPGSLHDRTGNPVRPAIRVTNAVLYGQHFSPLGIVQKAVELRASTMKRELRETVRANLKRSMRSGKLGR
jgi:hypothetical protein